jgi:K+-transporting ATPase ATPase C chain
MNMIRQIAPGLRIAVVMTILTGLVYPATATILSQALFPDKANGSLVVRNGQIIGSILLGQNFSRADYFHPRPSAAGEQGYDGSISGGSNLGPTSQELFDRIKTAGERFRSANPEFHGPIPADMVTASSSGLDPHISPASALAQVRRVAASRHTDPSHIQRLVIQFTEGRLWGILGEPRVNVLALNLALDEAFPSSK